MENENQEEVQEELGTGGKIKNWIQDNIRIIISVLIVIAIAGGIYSYSNRGEEAPISEEQLAIEESEEQTEEEMTDDVDSVEPGEEEAVSDEDSSEATEDEEADKDGVEKEDVKVSENGEGSSESISEETEEAFVETAAQGDSVTTLARKALKDYLEKNNDSSLTAEHKIYIEDYLRKNVDNPGTLLVGEKVNFSKQLIQNSIEKSKTLNENQLDNLKKYSARVSNL